MAEETPPTERTRFTWRGLEPRIGRALRVGVPVAAYLGAMAAAYFAFPFDRFVQWVSFMNGYLVLPLGREITIPVMLSAGFAVPESVGLVVLVDFSAASFIAWNMDLARSVPYLGGFIRTTEKAGADYRAKHPPVRALGLVGLFLWAVKPGRGSGGATSAILGKLVFVENHWLLPTIVSASLVGCTLVALAADAILRTTGVSLTVLGGALLTAVALYYLYNIRREVVGKLSGALRRDAANPGEE